MVHHIKCLRGPLLGITLWTVPPPKNPPLPSVVIASLTLTMSVLPCPPRLLSGETDRASAEVETPSFPLSQVPTMRRTVQKALVRKRSKG
jgi:hypothetical protein